MSKQKQSAEPKQNRNQPKVEADVTTEQTEALAEEMHPAAGLQMGDSSEPTENQMAARLNDPRIPLVQRRAMAGRIGEMQGNGHLQKMTIAIRQKPEEMSAYISYRGSSKNSSKPTEAGSITEKGQVSSMAPVQKRNKVNTATIQRDSKYADRPPTPIEASVDSLVSGQDSMGEFLANSSFQMLEAQTNLESASIQNEEQRQEYEAKIENLIRLNAIGLMASHRATVMARRADMFSSQAGESKVKPLRDAAANIHKLEEIKDRLEDYQNNLRTIESKALFRRGDLGENLDELALNSNQIMAASERYALVDRYQRVRQSSSTNMMWLFVHFSAQYMREKREEQIQGVQAALALFFNSFPVFSQLDAEDVAEEDYEDDNALEQEAQQSFGNVLAAINNTIRDIHSKDISPLDMPEAVRITREGLPPQLQTILDEMKSGHESFEFWLTLGLTTAEILLAFIPVIGPVLSLGVGVGNLAMQGEEMMDRMQMAEAGANPYGENPLGVTGSSLFEQTMFGVAAILTAVGAAGVIKSLRGGSVMDDVAEAAARGGDDLLEGGASVADDISERAVRGEDVASEGVSSSGSKIVESSSRDIINVKVNEAILKKQVIEQWSQGGKSGGNWPVKVMAVDPRNPDRVYSTVRGYITQEKFIKGRTPAEMESILGIPAGQYSQGVRVYKTTSLPKPEDFQLRGYTQQPGGKMWKPGDKYPIGEGAPQWEISPEASIPADPPVLINLGEKYTG